jgi:transcriptional regulator GlxA family with amidase domain
VINNRQIEVHIIRRGHPTANLILKNLYRLKELQSETDPEFQTRNILSEAWSLLMKELQENPDSQSITGTEQTNRLRSMIAYINQHYPEKITLAEIAKTAGVSEREATRCFKKSIGQSPMEYLIKYRLNQSKKLLLETDMTITRICQQCGFSDSAYFGKAFRKSYGMTPSEYRGPLLNSRTSSYISGT